MLAWFDEARDRLLESFRPLDPKERVPWFGPAMSAASSLTARIMETWAHGQDVADTLGATREPTARLRHVAHIGVGARAFSYAANGREQPQDPIRVELTAPDGDVWTWGPEDAADRVTGPAAGLLPGRHPAPPPRRRGPAGHRAGRDRVDVVRPGVRRRAGHRPREAGQFAEEKA